MAGTADRRRALRAAPRRALHRADIFRNPPQAELQRIDEDRDGDERRTRCASFIDERQMTFVQKTHRRHEADLRAVHSRRRKRSARFVDRPRGDHFAGSSTTAASGAVPYKRFSSSSPPTWNDSVATSGKRPSRTSARYASIATRMSAERCAYLRTNFGV